MMSSFALAAYGYGRAEVRGALVYVAVNLVGSILAISHHQPGFLDIALVLAMLGFVQTVAAARLIERRRDLG